MRLCVCASESYYTLIICLYNPEAHFVRIGLNTTAVQMCATHFSKKKEIKAGSSRASVSGTYSSEKRGASHPSSVAPLRIDSDLKKQNKKKTNNVLHLVLPQSKLFDLPSPTAPDWEVKSAARAITQIILSTALLLVHISWRSPETLVCWNF